MRLLLYVKMQLKYCSLQKNNVSLNVKKIMGNIGVKQTEVLKAKKW